MLIFFLVVLLGLLLWAWLLVSACILPTIVQYWLHWRDCRASGEVAPGLWTYGRVVALESLANLYIALLYPFGWWPPRRPEIQDSNKPIIVLLHGYAMNRSMLWPLKRWLRQQGIPNVVSLSLRPMFGAIEACSKDLLIRLQWLSEAHGSAPVYVVGHSMGGLAARWISVEAPQEPIHGVVSVASPHRGTRLAVFGYGVNARQMRPGSPFLQSLGDASGVPLHSIYTPTDNVVIPSTSSDVGERRVVVEGLGHNGLLFSGRAFRQIERSLRDMGAC